MYWKTHQQHLLQITLATLIITYRFFPLQFYLAVVKTV